ncbi:hypothetical protein BHE74_00006745 [Ensete ventricosum]|nr:hypothetical protein BHE74_00006745 [Ensete ventricosum]
MRSATSFDSSTQLPLHQYRYVDKSAIVRSNRSISTADAKLTAAYCSPYITPPSHEDTCGTRCELVMTGTRTPPFPSPPPPTLWRRSERERERERDSGRSLSEESRIAGEVFYCGAAHLAAEEVHISLTAPTICSGNLDFLPFSFDSSPLDRLGCLDMNSTIDEITLLRQAQARSTSHHMVVRGIGEEIDLEIGPGDDDPSFSSTTLVGVPTHESSAPQEQEDHKQLLLVSQVPSEGQQQLVKVPQGKRKKKVVKKWREEWADTYKWAYVDVHEGTTRIFCSICREYGRKHRRNPYGNEGSRNMQMSALEEHNNSLLHKEALRLQMTSKDKGLPVIEKSVYVKEDMGVGPREMGYLFGQYKRLTGHFQVFFARLILADMNKELKGLRFMKFQSLLLYALIELLIISYLFNFRCVISGAGKIAMHVLEKLFSCGAIPITISAGPVNIAWFVLEGKEEEEKRRKKERMKWRSIGRLDGQWWVAVGELELSHECNLMQWSPEDFEAKLQEMMKQIHERSLKAASEYGCMKDSPE